MSTKNLAIVFIGRNEAERLERCLESLKGIDAELVYVDSGSTDNSVLNAKNANAKIVELSPDRPFSAARARNEGFEALENVPEFVQFIDGDCAMQPEWIEPAIKAMQQDPKLGIVTGWRSEIYRNKSVYNALCDFEWRREAGEISVCGGDMLVRSAAFVKVGGFNETVIASEDEEICLRIGKAGWKLRRLPIEMTRHDIAMTKFSEWWQRAVRSGHGFAQVGTMHPEHFKIERKRAVVFAGILPFLALLAVAFWPYGLIAIAAVYLRSYIRSSQGLAQAGLASGEAWHHGLFLVLSKFPNLIGMGVFYWRRLRGHKMNIIEYK
ncbi:MAG TPA: glycosyl transferase [Rhodobacteraceae bacterium]|nr:glycosyl transferase [Paracoccaceae bacterium]